MPRLVLVAYTTTRPLPLDLALPPWIRRFDGAEAARFGQRAFILYLNRIAKLPQTRRWFPDLDTPTQGILGIADERLRQELLAVAIDVGKRRPELLRLSGP